MDMNRMTIIGNITAEPRHNITQGGKAVLNFSVCASTIFATATESAFESKLLMPVVAFWSLAEWARQKLSDKSRVYIEGRVVSSEIIDREWTFLGLTHQIFAAKIIHFGNSSQQNQNLIFQEECSQ